MPELTAPPLETHPLDTLLEPLQATARRHETPCGEGRMVWHEWGEGRAGEAPVVLLHGGSGSWRHWARNIPALASRHRVLAADLPGLGESDMPPRTDSPDAIAAIVAAGAEALLGGARYRLVGFSFGAMIGGHVARQVPERLASFTLVGAGAMGLRRRPTPMQPVRSLEGPAREAANRANLAALMLAHPGSIDATALALQDWHVRHARLRSRPFSGTTALRDALQGLPVPLSGIWGELDSTATPWLQDRLDLLRALQPDVALAVVPDAGHWVMWEAPNAFDAALQAVWGASRASGRGGS